MKLRYPAALLVLALVSACSDKPDKPPYAGIKIGQPYQIYGRWYKPKYEADYDETGRASWYGPGFHGNKTANGERFDENDLTAAHRTLPLPSIVRVTNLDNGRSAIIKVNDRGPFARDRILDLSKGAAAKLGVISNGTAKVRVQFLDKETQDYVSDSNTQGVRYAMNKLQGVDPAEAAVAQEERSKPQFYVMKVPAGHPAPPASIPVSEQVAANYPTRNIFEAVDHEEVIKSTTANTSVQPAVYVSKASPPLSVHPLQVSNAYYVQAGTFGSKDNAHRLIGRLGDEYDAHVMNMELGKNRKLYRVMIGPYKQYSMAKNMLSKLGRVGIPDAKIVRD